MIIDVYSPEEFNDKVMDLNPGDTMRVHVKGSVINAVMFDNHDLQFFNEGEDLIAEQALEGYLSEMEKAKNEH